MTLIKKISIISCISISSSSAFAFLSYSSRNIAKVEKKVKEEPRLKHEYDTDFFHWNICCGKSSNECKEKCIEPMGVF